MFFIQVHEYLGDHKFWYGVLGGVLFVSAFVIVMLERGKRANKKNDWWCI